MVTVVPAVKDDPQSATVRPLPHNNEAEIAVLGCMLLDPEDPVRYDFALSRLGIVGDCRHRRVAAVCSSCPIEGVCRL